MIDIITATEEHLEELVPLFEGYRVWYQQPAKEVEARAFLRARMTANESVIFLAFHRVDQRMVGFTQLYPLFSSTRLKRVWLLNDLFVEPSYRGLGISLKLIDAAKDLARETGAAGVQLETDKTNDIGNHLYPRADFQLNTDQNFYFWLVN